MALPEGHFLYGEVCCLHKNMLYMCMYSFTTSFTGYLLAAVSLLVNSAALRLVHTTICAAMHWAVCPFRSPAAPPLLFYVSVLCSVHLFVCLFVFCSWAACVLPLWSRPRIYALHFDSFCLIFWANTQTHTHPDTLLHNSKCSCLSAIKWQKSRAHQL